MDNHIDNLLLLFLRSPWDPAGRPDPLPDDVDAAALVQLALAEGVAPLLYGRLRGETLLPPAAMQPLRQAYYANAARNARLLHELETILRALAAAHVPVLLLKGAALALAVYDNPALRPMGDVDLLVYPADVDAALQALAGLGYRPVQREPAPGSIRTYENELILGKEGGIAPLELHWALFDSPHHQHHLPMGWFWQTAIPLEIGAATVRGRAIPVGAAPLQGRGSTYQSDAPPIARILGPEAQVIHLCAHLVLHHGGDAPHLPWLHDIAEVVSHYQGEIDWPAVPDQARACDLLVPLQQVLPRVAHDWQAPIPPTALERLSQLAPSRAEARIVARLTGLRPAGRRLWDDLATTPGWLRRLRFAWVNLFPTPAYMRQRYQIRHPLLLPFYYPYRWLLGLRGLLASGGR